MTRSSLSSGVELRGPLFRGDPGKVVRRNVEAALERAAAAGARAARAELSAGEARRLPVSRIGGRVADHVQGRTRSLAGRSWSSTAIVSVVPLGAGADGVALMAAASLLERRTHALEGRAAAAMRAELLRVDTTRGLE